jgi:hypothetical protein
MTRIASSRRVLGVEHLLSKFRYCDCTVLLTPTRCKGEEASQEGVKTREGHCNTNELRVTNSKGQHKPMLTASFGDQSSADQGSANTRRDTDTRHYNQNKMVKIAICLSGRL